MIKIVECPRDAMQGIHDFIPTDRKVAYLNQLLRVGFDTLDFGSFVSPKAIPQMRDTAAVLRELEWRESDTKLLAIVANERGARDAVLHEAIRYLGYPFSVSETFQLRNTNATIAESLQRVQIIQEICQSNDKELVVYLSMGFGNPYGDDWNVKIVEGWAKRLEDLGIRILSLSDTIGVAKPESIRYLFSHLIPELPNVEFGAHLHTEPHNWREKIDAAFESGCYRFDSAMLGYGGCPMAKDDLTGNMPTERLIMYFTELHPTELSIDQDAFRESSRMALSVFP